MTAWRSWFRYLTVVFAGAGALSCSFIHIGDSSNLSECRKVDETGSFILEWTNAFRFRSVVFNYINNDVTLQSNMEKWALGHDEIEGISIIYKPRTEDYVVSIHMLVGETINLGYVHKNCADSLRIYLLAREIRLLESHE